MAHVPLIALQTREVAGAKPAAPILRNLGHDPIKATGLVLAHITRICEPTRPDSAQVWRLRTSTKPAEYPWSFLERVAGRRDTDAQALYLSERLSKAKLRRSPLG